VLSQVVRVDGNDTRTLLAQFVMELIRDGLPDDGTISLHPEAPRCLDPEFVSALTRSAVFAREALEHEGIKMGDSRVRIQTVRASHEVFLIDRVLCGPSGTGALTLGIYGLHRGGMSPGRRLAASFDLAADAGTGARSAVVGGGEEKVRCCADQNVACLLVAEEQQSDLLLYGNLHGVDVLGTANLTQAIALLAGRAGTRRPVPRDSAPLRYIDRATDEQFLEAVRGRESIISVMGARQMGKTSLLRRGVELADRMGIRVVYTDLQILEARHVETPNTLFRALATMIAEDLDLRGNWREDWNPDAPAGHNMKQFLKKALDSCHETLFWSLDSADRLLPCPYSNDVFGFFRLLYNLRSNEPAGPWGRLLLVILHAAEASLFISNQQQSPFNVGIRLRLEDLTREQTAEANQRYGSPLRSEAELDRFYRLVAGHPYLVTCGLAAMQERALDIDAFENQADQDHSVYRSHLRQLLEDIRRNPLLAEFVRDVMRREGGTRSRPTLSRLLPWRRERSARSNSAADRDLLGRLLAAGVFAPDSTGAPRMRCLLYARYLGRHLE
jgi:hypothetical protein